MTLDGLGEFDLVERMIVALAIGLLFGIERGWKTREQHGGRRTAGLRTFVLIGLVGGVAGLLSGTVGDVVLGFVFLGVALLVVASYVTTQLRVADPDLGTTTEVAALLTFLLAVLAGTGQLLLPIAVSVVAVTFLHGKRLLHRWLANVERLELAAALQLLVISVVLLPVLPDQGFGPGGVLNPFQIWLMVVLISGLSFIGYIACRLTGPRFGPLIVGLLGGLASSTAVTLSFSRMARRSPQIGKHLVGGIAMASIVMFVRVLVLVQIFQPDLVMRLLAPMLIMAAITLVCGLVLALRDGSPSTTRGDLDLTDPSELGTAVGFGLLLAAVTLASYLVNHWIGQGAVYGVAFVSGLVDVDAITLSMSKLAGTEGFLPRLAANAIVLAVLTNSAVKLAIAAIVAGGATARSAAIVFGLTIAGGAVALVAV